MDRIARSIRSSDVPWDRMAFKRGMRAPGGEEAWFLSHSTRSVPLRRRHGDSLAGAESSTGDLPHHRPSRPARMRRRSLHVKLRKLVVEGDWQEDWEGFEDEDGA